MFRPFRTVLISGGTGSLGHALTRLLLDTTNVTIRILSRGEHRQADMHAFFQNDRIRYLIGDVRDYQRVLLACHAVDLVIHAAALKRQPTLEYNVYEGVQTNVIGTHNVLMACAAAGVERCITVSSDKACLPVTLYGQTKAVAEALTIQANAYSPTGVRSCVVRWGNVAGSQGSVILIWREALRRGEKLGITDAAATRFWVDMNEAVRLVWYVATAPTRGMIYVPHSPAFNVEDLALALVRQECGGGFYDFNTKNDLVSHVMAIPRRPAEKLHELLMTEEEQRRALWIDGMAQWRMIPSVAQTWATPAAAREHVAPAFFEPLGTAYASDVWSYRLGVEELRERLETL